MTTPLCCYCHRPFEHRQIRQWIGISARQAAAMGYPSPVAHQRCYERRKRTKRTPRVVQTVMGVMEANEHEQR